MLPWAEYRCPLCLAACDAGRCKGMLPWARCRRLLCLAARIRNLLLRGRLCFFVACGHPAFKCEGLRLLKLL